MKKKNLLFFSVMVVVGMLTAWSCKKDEDKTVTNQEAIAVVKEDINANILYDNIFREVEDIMTDLELEKYPAAGSSKKSGSNLSILVTKNSGDSTVFPKEIKVGFSDYYFQGRKVNGTINITQSARIRKIGAKRTVTLQDFIFDDTLKVEGVKTITVISPVNAKPAMKVELSGGKVTNTRTNNYLTREFTRTITQTEGIKTPFVVWDDYYSIESTGSGSNKNGFSFSAKTTEPLIFGVSTLCAEKGKIEIKVENKTVYVDYNREYCSDKIKIVVEGTVEEVYIW